MFRAENFQIVKHWKQKKIAKQVRNGITPAGVSKEEIWEALRETKPKNVVEMFGFLSAVAHNADGTLKKDYGLVSHYFDINKIRVLTHGQREIFP